MNVGVEAVPEREWPPEATPPKEIRCVYCGRRKVTGGEGRWIDGSWFHDRFLPKTFRDKWVCSFHCYGKLLRLEQENARG